MTYDTCDDETRPDPDCDDCGGFRIMNWNADKGEWFCPDCEPTEDDDE